MINLAIALALTAVSGPGNAQGAAIFVATSAEKASGFKSLAECEQAIGKSGDAGHADARGTVFNRNAGNTTRCEIVAGEPLVVVYPKGYEAMRAAH